MSLADFVVQKRWLCFVHAVVYDFVDFGKITMNYFLGYLRLIIGFSRMTVSRQMMSEDVIKRVWLYGVLRIWLSRNAMDSYELRFLCVSQKTNFSRSWHYCAVFFY